MEENSLTKALKKLGIKKREPKPKPRRYSYERRNKTIKGELGYELMREDGLCRVREGIYARCIQLSDINYQGARYSTQLEIHGALMELVNEFDANAGFQWFLNTRLISDEEFRESMRYDDVPGEDVLNAFRREQNAILENSILESSFNASRTLHIVIHVRETCMQKAAPALDRICTAVERKLSALECAPKVLDGREWLELANRVLNPNDPEGMVSYSDLLAHPGASTLDLIAPSCLRKDKGGLMVGERHAKVLYVQKYSATVRDDFLSQIAELAQDTAISVHVTPLDQADSLKMVETQLLSLKQEKRNYVLAHPQTAMFDDEMLPGSLGDSIVSCSKTRDDLVKGNQRLFMVTICLLVHADTAEALSHSVKAVEQVARGFTYRLAPAANQVDALKSCLPFGNCSIPQERQMSTDPLANFVPFTSDELYHKGGQYMGRNMLSNRHIFYDRAHAVAPNGFILGKPGRGKSVTAKSSILWTLITDPDARVIVLDPEGEYGVLCKELGGQLVKVSASSSTHINPLDLTLGYSSEDADTASDPLPLKCDFVVSMVRQMVGTISSVEETLVDRVCAEIYAPFLSSGNPDDMPILEDLYDALHRQAEPQAKALATTIERYVKGTMSVFNHRTNVNMDSRLIVFDTKDLGSNLAPLSLLILLDQTWNIITAGRRDGRNTWFYVDELQLIMDNPQARAYFDTLYSRARKWFAIPTGITQNVTRLLECSETRLMVQNSDFLMILGQSFQDAQALAEVLSLSDSQFKTISSASVGEGLLVAERKVIPYRNIIPKELNGKPTKTYRLMTTKPSDILEMRREKKAS